MLKVSVIIPLYNKGPHITRALDSVFTQTVQDFEIVVVDGNSTDKGPSIVKNWNDPRVRFIVQEGTGVSAARNQGVEMSQADFIAFLDADDEWESDHLETLLKLYNAYPEAGLYSTAYFLKYSDNDKRMKSLFAIPKEPWEGLVPSYFKSAARGGSPVWTSVVGMSKRIFMEMQGFNTAVRRGEDTDLWGRIALKYPIAFSWNGKGIYHLDASNRACNRVEALDEHIFISSALKAIELDEVSPDMCEDIRKYISRKQIERAEINIRAGRLDLAREIVNQSITLQNMRLIDWLYLSIAFGRFLTKKIVLIARSLSHLKQ